MVGTGYEVSQTWIIAGQRYLSWRAVFNRRRTRSEMSDFFSHFRQVASSVDRQSTDLKSALDNPSFDENRSCLLLKRILDEVRNLQVKAGALRVHTSFYNTCQYGTSLEN